MHHVGLFVTCLVDLFRPSVGFAALKLLRRNGCQVVVPAEQTCCGQPAYNSGDRENARGVARTLIDAFESVDYVVAPSGSCAGMVRQHYPQLFEEQDPYYHRARALAAKTWELTRFLTEIIGNPVLDGECQETVTYHDSCSGLRELGIHRQPRQLLGAIEGLELRECEDGEVCCGFGGTFCTKYPRISTRMVDDKAKAVEATQAALLIGGDMGCLLNIAGRLARRGSKIPVRHIAEVLAGETYAQPMNEVSS